jgi:hypothetical protein
MLRLHTTWFPTPSCFELSSYISWVEVVSSTLREYHKRSDQINIKPLAFATIDDQDQMSTDPIDTKARECFQQMPALRPVRNSPNSADSVSDLPCAWHVTDAARRQHIDQQSRYRCRWLSPQNSYYRTRPQGYLLRDARASALLSR